MHNAKVCVSRIIKNLRGKSLKWIKKNKPKGWRTLRSDNGKGWKWVDENGVERLRFQRPQKGKVKWEREKNGYFRWKNEADQYLDIDGNVVDKSKMTIDEFQEKTHIPYEGP